MKEVIIADGRKTFREFCITCGKSNGGTNLGFSIPTISDENLIIGSFKYKNKTLGEIAKVDKNYLLWIVTKSKSSSREKKAAARLFFGIPYSPPRIGDIYHRDKIYDIKIGKELITRMIQGDL